MQEAQKQGFSQCGWETSIRILPAHKESNMSRELRSNRLKDSWPSEARKDAAGATSESEYIL